MHTTHTTIARQFGQFVAGPAAVIALSIGGSILFGIPFGAFEVLRADASIPLSNETLFLVGFQTGAALGGIAGAVKGFALTEGWSVPARAASGLVAAAIVVLAVLNMFGVR